MKWVAALARDRGQGNPRRALGLPWLALLALALACASNNDEKEPMDEPLAVNVATVTAGNPAPEAEYVVKLTDARTHALRCTASLIGPRLLLTAAHCLVEGTADRGAELCATLETTSGTTRVRVADSFVHDDFAVLGPMATSFANDLAVLELARPVSVVPLELELEASAEAGEAVQVLGYGRTSAEQHDEGQRRTTLATVASTTAADFTLAGPTLPCVFDSGGPVLSMASGRQLGVVSSGDAECASHARIMALNAAAAFIDPYLQSNQSSDSDDNGECARPDEPDGAQAGCNAAAAPALASQGELWLMLGLVAARRRWRATSERSAA